MIILHDFISHKLFLDVVTVEFPCVVLIVRPQMVIMYENASF